MTKFIVLFAFMFVVEVYADEPQITSKQVEFRTKEKRIIFKDNVHIKYDNNLLISDLAVKNEKSKTVELTGNVKGYYYFNGTTDTVRINANNGVWNLESNEIELTGRPWLVYTSTAGQKVEIESDKIVLEEKTDTSRFYDNVIVKYKQSRAQSEFAQYEKGKSKVILLARNGILPSVDYSNGHHAIFVAEQITMLPDNEKMIMEKRANIKIFNNQ